MSGKIIRIKNKNFGTDAFYAGSRADTIEETG